MPYFASSIWCARGSLIQPAPCLRAYDGTRKFKSVVNSLAWASVAVAAIHASFLLCWAEEEASRAAQRLAMHVFSACSVTALSVWSAILLRNRKDYHPTGAISSDVIDAKMNPCATTGSLVCCIHAGECPRTAACSPSGWPSATAGAEGSSATFRTPWRLLASCARAGTVAGTSVQVRHEE